MRYLLHAMGMQWKSALQYRSSLVMQMISQFVMTGGELVAVLALLARFTTIGHWTGEEILFFFGMMQTVFALVECVGRGITTFAHRMIATGQFDTLLLRPQPLLLQVIGSELDPRRAGSMLVGLAAILAANANLHLTWTVEKVLLLALSTFGSMLLMLGLFLIEATMSFFAIRSIEMVNLLTYGGRSMGEYPIDIYPRPMQRFFTWVVPFALCLHWPVSALIGHPMVSAPWWVFFLTPLVGGVFFGVMVGIWYVGVRHYRSTGT